MPKRAIASTCKDPENRSKKACVCGGHSAGARKPRYKDKRRRTLRMTSLEIVNSFGAEGYKRADTFQRALESLVGSPCTAFEKDMCGTPCMTETEAVFESCCFYRKEEKS